MSVYLFDMAGEPIAHRRTWSDTHVFDLEGHWIGWFPWEDNEVVDRDGHYLGTIVDDRLVRRNDRCERLCRPIEDVPGRTTPSGQPQVAHDFPNRFAYEDLPNTHAA